jgi:hypothetical protein
VDKQKVFRGVSGMKTDSIWWPSVSCKANLMVPSLDVCRSVMTGVDTLYRDAKSFRS